MLCRQIASTNIEQPSVLLLITCGKHTSVNKAKYHIKISFTPYMGQAFHTFLSTKIG